MTQKKRTIIHLTGGLGNQMCQYAYGIYLKNKSNDVRLLYSKSKCQHNDMELEKIFKLNINTYFWLECVVLLKIITRKFVKNKSGILSKILNNTLKSAFTGIHFMNLYYLADNKDKIITAFTFPKFEDEKNLKLAKKIKNTHSVSIHIRLGDYLQGNFINLSKTNYYLLAVEKIKQIQAERGEHNLTFFIFSDEVDECKEKLNISNIIGKNYYFVSYNQGENAFRDMQLMSLCKHNIIANSSFGFWASYLNKNEDKIVICPKSHAQYYDKRYIKIDQDNFRKSSKVSGFTK